MLLRSVLLRPHQDQRLANFCSLKNVESNVSSKRKSPEKGHVISYLVNSCGLSPENAISASEQVHFVSPDRPDAVLDFLEKHGFSKSQIAELVRRRPKFLVSKPETFLPKMEFFTRSIGIPENVVAASVSRYPSLLSRSLDQRLAPNYNYLNGVIGSQRVEALFKRGSWTFGHLDLEKVIPNVDLLREVGVPPSFIALTLTHYPEIVGVKHAELREVVEEVKQMGFDPLKSMFILAIHARVRECNRALMDRCYTVYSRWGWSEDDILTAFRRYPNCMLCSEKKISAVLEFVVSELGREARSVALCPNIISFNMESRIVPRFSVVHLLSLRGLVKKDWGLSGVLCLTEKAFLNRYVTLYTKELPELYEVYESKKLKAVEWKTSKKAKAMETKAFGD